MVRWLKLPVKPIGFDWHSWIGVYLGLMLFSICWSGAFASLSSEIDWLLFSGARTNVHENPFDFSAAFEVVVNSYPDAKIELAEAPADRVSAARFTVKMPDVGRRFVYVDQTTLKITGSQSIFTVQRFFREYHEAFFGLYGIGKFLVCLFAIPLFLSMLSAFYFFKRWWQRFFDLRLGKTTISFWSGLHKLAGLWSLWFVVVMTTTGAWYLFEETRYKLGDEKFALVDAYPLAVRQLRDVTELGQERLTVSDLIDIAQSQRPDLRISTIQPDRRGYFYVIGQSDDVLVRDRANKLFLNPFTGVVTFNQHADDLNAYWRWSETADILHFGTFAGLVSKIVWFVFGVLLAGLSLSGAWLYVQKQSKRKQSRWPKADLAACVALLVPISALPIVWIYLHRVGGKIDGQYHMAELPDGVAVFIIGWVFVTLIIKLLWVIGIFSLQRKAVGQTCEA
ncbi:PepSY-associated TM helix domain-containing protein [Thalassospira lucentensis]|uniref:Peptidase n=1 Tax=Thalassospira lucentensis TaxID=168935 RepID=A0A358HW60_9PROT|nr:PepSY-associated TM helix domain-containing protein [Thalassospira lucentensis]HBU99416.1 peptidase [Thalassospira lucentensis]HCW69505.1 peptidase [Thalassospira lucentensis]|tara:strand:+ start:4508 stop:5860 length:1353 start_codon:yes stop_codon:yes gene_type:complete